MILSNNMKYIDLDIRRTVWLKEIELVKSSKGSSFVLISTLWLQANTWS